MMSSNEIQKEENAKLKQELEKRDVQKKEGRKQKVK